MQSGGSYTQLFTERDAFCWCIFLKTTGSGKHCTSLLLNSVANTTIVLCVKWELWRHTWEKGEWIMPLHAFIFTHHQCTQVRALKVPMGKWGNMLLHALPPLQFKVKWGKKGWNIPLHAPSPITCVHGVMLCQHPRVLQFQVHTHSSHFLGNASYRQKCMFPHPILFFKGGAWCMLNSALSARLTIGL